MFYGTLILSKKGPLSKVWLAAHWDKKLTKAHVFETDVESTVDSIISPQVKLALRTSGHLLLGVVRIYSRKQKYLIHDLGEACAKIKMAFRPGIVDLPSDGGAENADAITLPEIFHDFETAVSDFGALDIEAQFTINPSRASEITMAEDSTTTTGGGDVLGIADFDLKGGDFEGGMEDIEVPRNAKVGGFGEESDITERSGNIQVSDMTGGSDPSKLAGDITLEERFPDAANDFGGGGILAGDGFGLMDGGFGDLGDFPPVPDLNLEAIEKDEMETEKKADEVPMEVDPPQEQPKTPEEQPSGDQGDQTIVAAAGGEPPVEESFELDPVDATRMEEKRAKRKRRLVVDNDKEFSGQQIKSQFEDYKDLLQPKCFPPPTKKAMMWKEMAGCDQLFSNPTTAGLGTELFNLITRNYTVDIPGEPTSEALVELDNIDTSRDANTSKDESDIEKPRGEPPTSKKDQSPEQDRSTKKSLPQVDADVTHPDGENLLDDLGDDLRPFDMDGFGGMDGIGGDPEDTSKVIPAMPDIDEIPTQSTEEQQSGELLEEFEQRRWTKRTQQVLRVLGRSLTSENEIQFSSLTKKCNRKQAASRFYTCLLLAKEGMIALQQTEPYAEILLQKGPKFIET